MEHRLPGKVVWGVLFVFISVFGFSGIQKFLIIAFATNIFSFLLGEKK